MTGQGASSYTEIGALWADELASGADPRGEAAFKARTAELMGLPAHVAVDGPCGSWQAPAGRAFRYLAGRHADHHRKGTDGLSAVCSAEFTLCQAR